MAGGTADAQQDPPARPFPWRKIMNQMLRDWLVPPVLLPLAIVLVLVFLLASNW